MKRNKETGIFELDNNEEKFEGVVCKIGKVKRIPNTRNSSNRTI